MKSGKSFLILLLALTLAAPGLLRAEEVKKGTASSPGMTNDRFQARKARMVQRMEAHTACIKAANSPADMQACRESAKKAGQQEKIERIQQQRKKLDEKERTLRGGQPAPQ